MSSNTKDVVLAELRRKKVKLWLPPYWMGKNPNRASLERFADTISGKGSKEEIVAILLDLQAHALEKLENKKHRVVECLEVKILGLQSDPPSNEELPTTWSEHVEVSEHTLQLHKVNSELTASKFLGELLGVLKADAVRLVYKGKSISPDDQARLNSFVVQGAAPAAKMLCLALYDKEDDEDRALIGSIRQAANKLGRNQFDVTDQHGNLVSMLPAERLAFLTALGLHRLGSKRSTLASSLVFLLEADKEWDNVTPRWRDRVDNYGLLQLEIAWIYLKLESIENLTDVVRRLELAESVLRKQVHTNFVTLAVAQAEMGNAVPPLSAVFCRLFLLQGVAYKLSKDEKKSAERLDWAWSLCQRLRSVSSIERIEGLCEALGVSQSQAISALRRSNGNSDQAATLVEKETADEELQDMRRVQQRHLGLCQNTVDHVDLNLVPQVQTVLGLQPAVAQRESSWEMDASFILAAGLLRLSNNDLQKSIDIYQDVQRSEQAVIERIAALDEMLVAEGFAAKKRLPRRRAVEETKIDEVSLATLISMGVEESDARKALIGSKNNVEGALLWLTCKSDSEGMDASEASYGTETPKAEEAATMDTGDADDADDADTSRAEAATMDKGDANDVDGTEAPRPTSKEANESNDAPSDSMVVESAGEVSGDSGEESDASKRARYQEEQEERAKRQAELLLEQELGAALQERDLEKDYFGSKLDEEWSFIQKFRAMS